MKATTAWIVPVWKKFGELGPILMVYVAAFESAEEARKAVIQKLEGAEGIDVREAAAINPSTTEALELAHGQVSVM